MEAAHAPQLAAQVRIIVVGKRWQSPRATREAHSRLVSEQLDANWGMTGPTGRPTAMGGPPHSPQLAAQLRDIVEGKRWQSPRETRDAHSRLVSTHGCASVVRAARNSMLVVDERHRGVAAWQESRKHNSWHLFT